MGWELARLAAGVGGFRVLPRGEAPPREVRVRLAEHLPPGTTYAVMRANHEGRYVALLVGEQGEMRAVAKIALTGGGEAVLAREAEAIERYGPLLPSPVRAPRVLAASQGVLLLEAVPFRPRRRPWELPLAVASALGALAREGVCHGDAAPWNLLDAGEGFVLIDWEEAGPAPSEAWDLCHWLVQAHALLERPRRRTLLRALQGAGPLGAAVRAYARAAAPDLERLPSAMLEYLRLSAEGLDAARPDGERGLAVRRALAEAVEGLTGLVGAGVGGGALGCASSPARTPASRAKARSQGPDGASPACWRSSGRRG